MPISQIKLYDLFRRELHLPDEKAAVFVMAVGEMVGSSLENDRKSLATKMDVHSLEIQIHSLELKIEQFKTDIYKAIFWSNIGQLIAILGGMLAIVRFLK